MNRYVELEKYIKLEIYGNKHEGYIFIDKEDLDKIKSHSWYIKDGNPIKYVAAKINNKTIKLHRFILDEKDSKIIIDHINRNPYDNRKENLRRTNHSNNNINCNMSKNNTSGRTGVIYRPEYRGRSATWYAQIRVGSINKKN